MSILKEGPIRKRLREKGFLKRSPEFVGEKSIDLEPIPATREERLRKAMQISIQPRAKDIMGNLREVYDKIYNVPNEICWRCRLNIDSHCTAFLLVASEKDQEYRRGATALCIYILDGRIAK